ncbi:MAG: DinB family protein [Spirochaetales bacterium]|nr:DinB family protein [Spirochaetales bacterium]
MKSKTIKHLLFSLEKAPKILKEFAGSLDDEALDRKRGSTVWTLREHIYHLAKVQPVLYKRLETFRDKDPVEIAAYYPAKEETKEQDNEKVDFASIKDALKEFKTWRKKQVKMVKGLKQKVFDKKASHSQYTRYDLGILLRHILMHDYWHMYRMEDIWLCKDEFFQAEPE